jgi:hypothetical protein
MLIVVETCSKVNFWFQILHNSKIMIFWLNKLHVNYQSCFSNYYHYVSKPKSWKLLYSWSITHIQNAFVSNLCIQQLHF